MKCEICGREFNTSRGLGGHIVQKHHVTPNQYYDQYLLVEGANFCKVCGKPTRFLNLTFGYFPHCSVQCSHKDIDCIEKRNATNLERYGVINVLSKGTKIREKAKKTIKERYGSTEIFSTKHFQEKHKENSLQKYGTEWPMQNKDVFARNMKSKRHYFYNNTHFDSTWELAFGFIAQTRLYR